MQIVIVSATDREILPAIEFYSDIKNSTSGYPAFISLQKNNAQIHFLITGPGINHTAYQLGKIFATAKYDIAINAGVCGSFLPSLQIGETVHVISEQFADCGAQDDDAFLNMHELELLYTESGIFNENILYADTHPDSETLSNLKKMKGITVNTVHGNTISIQNIIQRTHADVESMEGAAFFYACKREKIPFIELRAVSNFIERRNKTNWNIPLAVQNLNLILIRLVEDLIQ